MAAIDQSHPVRCFTIMNSCIQPPPVLVNAPVLVKRSLLYSSVMEDSEPTLIIDDDTLEPTELVSLSSSERVRKIFRRLSSGFSGCSTAIKNIFLFKRRRILEASASWRRSSPTKDGLVVMLLLVVVLLQVMDLLIVDL